MAKRWQVDGTHTIEYLCDSIMRKNERGQLEVAEMIYTQHTGQCNTAIGRRVGLIKITFALDSTQDVEEITIPLVR